MNKKTQGWIELISYGMAGVFSATLFVFGALFPKYMFTDEGFGKKTLTEERVELSVRQIEEIRQKLLQNEDMEDIRVSFLTYECLKEIIDEWD